MRTADVLNTHTRARPLSALLTRGAAAGCRTADDKGASTQSPFCVSISALGRQMRLWSTVKVQLIVCHPAAPLL